MAKYRKKPVVIEAITFDELVEHGKTKTGIVNGMPWSFDYKGQPITHENDDCSLIPTLEGTMRFERGDMLITGVKGEIYPCKADIFAATYDPVPGKSPASEINVHVHVHPDADTEAMMKSLRESGYDRLIPGSGAMGL